MKKFNDRCKAIEERRTYALLKRQGDITRRKMRATQENDKLTQEIEPIGLWMNRGGVLKGDCRTYQGKLKSLKVQIKFRQKVFAQHYPDSSILAFSSRGKAHSLKKLNENFGKLVDETEHNESSTSPEQETFAPTRTTNR